MQRELEVLIESEISLFPDLRNEPQKSILVYFLAQGIEKNDLDVRIPIQEVNEEMQKRGYKRSDIVPGIYGLENHQFLDSAWELRDEKKTHVIFPGYRLREIGKKYLEPHS